MPAFRTSRRVEFADTDMVGFCHFARFFIFMETAEHQFLEALGASVNLEHEGESYRFPRVSVACDYLAPAFFGDPLDLALDVERVGETSITYAIAITRDERPIARGRTTAVCCRLAADGSVRPASIPHFLAARLRAVEIGAGLPASE